MQIETLLSLLDKVRQTGPQKWIARCPSHDDNYPSLAIRETPENNLLIHCFSGCSVHEITRALGIELHQLFPENIPLEGRKPIKKPFMSVDIQDMLMFELTMISIGLNQMLNDGCTREDIQAIIQTAERIMDAVEATTGHNDRIMSRSK